MARSFIAALILVLAGIPNPSPAQNKLTETQKIEALIRHIEELKNAKFIRNDKEYDPKTAAYAMRRKWKAYKDKVKTAADFIDKVASLSSTSGRPYYIRFDDGKEMKLGNYLHQELKKMEKSSR